MHLSQSQARQQQRFSKLEERNITILLPREKSQQPQETSGSPDREMAESEEEEEEEERELEIVAQLWRERMAHDEVERFETNAAKKLRLLRSAKVYPYVVLRVRLPGGVFLQGRFNPQETWEVRIGAPGCISYNASTVYKLPRSVLLCALVAFEQKQLLQHTSPHGLSRVIPVADCVSGDRRKPCGRGWLR